MLRTGRTLLATRSLASCAAVPAQQIPAEVLRALLTGNNLSAGDRNLRIAAKPRPKNGARIAS